MAIEFFVRLFLFRGTICASGFMDVLNGGDVGEAAAAASSKTADANAYAQS